MTDRRRCSILIRTAVTAVLGLVPITGASIHANMICIVADSDCSSFSMRCDPIAPTCNWCDDEDPQAMEGACVPNYDYTCISTGSVDCGRQWTGNCSISGFCSGKNADMGVDCSVAQC